MRKVNIKYQSERYTGLKTQNLETHKLLKTQNLVPRPLPQIRHR
jgi:hypothetical protein